MMKMTKRGNGKHGNVSVKLKHSPSQRVYLVRKIGTDEKPYPALERNIYLDEEILFEIDAIQWNVHKKIVRLEG